MVAVRLECSLGVVNGSGKVGVLFVRWRSLWETKAGEVVGVFLPYS